MQNKKPKFPGDFGPDETYFLNRLIEEQKRRNVYFDLGRRNRSFNKKPKFPGDFGPEDADLFNRLIEKRILLIRKAITPELVDLLIDGMMRLNYEDPKKEITVLITTSEGGNIISTRMFYTAMQYVDADVKTVAIGKVDPMGSLLLAGGQFNKRLVFPDAEISIFQPLSVFLDQQGRKTGLGFNDPELFPHWEWWTETLGQRTGRRSWEEISHELHSDRFMFAKEAQAYGIADRIVEF